MPVQIFWARPKIELKFSAPPKSFGPAQKLNLLYENHLLVWHKKFGTGTLCKSVFGMAQKIWSSQNVLGPVKGKGINWRNSRPSHLQVTFENSCEGRLEAYFCLLLYSNVYDLYKWCLKRVLELFKAQPFGLLSCVRQEALYCDWLLKQAKLINQNTELPKLGY